MPMALSPRAGPSPRTGSSANDAVLEVVADRGLTEWEMLLDVDHTRRLNRQQVQHGHAMRIAKRLELGGALLEGRGLGSGLKRRSTPSRCRTCR